MNCSRIILGKGDNFCKATIFVNRKSADFIFRVSLSYKFESIAAAVKVTLRNRCKVTNATHSTFSKIFRNISVLKYTLYLTRVLS